MAFFDVFEKCNSVSEALRVRDEILKINFFATDMLEVCQYIAVGID